MKEQRFEVGDCVTIGKPPYLYSVESHITGFRGTVAVYDEYFESYGCYILYITCADGVRKVLERELVEYHTDNLFPIY